MQPAPTDAGLIKYLRRRRGDGADLTAAMSELEAAGVSIIHAIEAVRGAFDLSLENAKEARVASGHWADHVEAARPLHDDFETLVTACSRKKKP